MIVAALILGLFLLFSASLIARELDELRREIGGAVYRLTRPKPEEPTRGE